MIVKLMIALQVSCATTLSSPVIEDDIAHALTVKECVEEIRDEVKVSKTIAWQLCDKSERDREAHKREVWVYRILAVLYVALQVLELSIKQ